MQKDKQRHRFIVFFRAFKKNQLFYVVNKSQRCMLIEYSASSDIYDQWEFP